MIGALAGGAHAVDSPGDAAVHRERFVSFQASISLFGIRISSGWSVACASEPALIRSIDGSNAAAARREMC